jgi:hypothetical protein
VCGRRIRLFSLTGTTKSTQSRARSTCLRGDLAADGAMAHVIVWGRIEIRVDDEAQEIWEAMITKAFGADGLGARSRRLSREGTMLGLLTPERHRIYGIES